MKQKTANNNINFKNILIDSYEANINLSRTYAIDKSSPKMPR
jgi:hypothetical protein